VLLPDNKRDLPMLLRNNHNAAQAHRSLSIEFLHDLYESWKVHGRKVLDELARDYPQVYGPMVARLAHVHRLEVGAPDDFNVSMTRAELLDKVGERFGAQGRAIFENFVKRLDRLQQERQTDDEAGALGWHAHRRRLG
jgi:hypothetical protein